MPPSSVSGVEFVADLIDAELASWNLNFVKELFPPCEVAWILATPLSCRLHSDKLMWHYDSKVPPRPPGFGWVKINVDGYFLAESNVGGVGVVFRDEVGSYARGFIRQISPASNPTMVELISVCEGHPDLSSPMDLLVEDIRVSLWGFMDSQVCYVRHTANVAAHCMVKLAVSSSFDFCWFEESLDLIVKALFDIA
ncbi:hypothetical protein D8674_026098 [Pyrus ussuriensis x Pyrus communis]|uniref:RNase H type-1 domain-containing protein n=1 Tax=Pyrus ussuriensis x Pyrus communis TaxID=2448454 RepID=A0A5N5IKC1_9ROSA|nr:hypothetical protein D8674_026098 [Pyrus ussuriensis x Pyrus communis]